jgi:hypothetical protein
VSSSSSKCGLQCHQRRLTPPSSGRQKGFAFLPPLMSNVRRRGNMRASSCVVAITFAASAAAAPGPMFPLPPTAGEFRHTPIQPRVYEQDSFVVSEAFPGSGTLKHYRAVFAKWRSCPASAPDWQSFEDSTSGNRRRVHQHLQHWVSPRNDLVVTVAIRYLSAAGAGSSAPEGTDQHVVVLRLRTQNASAEATKLGVKCGSSGA